MDKFVSKSKKPSASMENKVARAELTLTTFVTEHNTSFLQAECCKAMFPDIATAQKMTPRQNKAAYAVQHDIAHYERLEITSVCKSQKFFQ